MENKDDEEKSALYQDLPKQRKQYRKTPIKPSNNSYSNSKNIFENINLNNIFSNENSNENLDVPTTPESSSSSSIPDSPLNTNSNKSYNSPNREQLLNGFKLELVMQLQEFQRYLKLVLCTMIFISLEIFFIFIITIYLIKFNQTNK